MGRVGYITQTSTPDSNTVITDTGNFYTTDTIEAALQEIGTTLASLDARITVLEP